MPYNFLSHAIFLHHICYKGCEMHIFGCAFELFLQYLHNTSMAFLFGYNSIMIMMVMPILKIFQIVETCCFIHRQSHFLFALLIFTVAAVSAEDCDYVCTWTVEVAVEVLDVLAIELFLFYLQEFFELFDGAQFGVRIPKGWKKPFSSLLISPLLIGRRDRQAIIYLLLLHHIHGKHMLIKSIQILILIIIRISRCKMILLNHLFFPSSKATFIIYVIHLQSV